MRDSCFSGSLRQTLWTPTAPIEMQRPGPTTTTPKRMTTGIPRPSSLEMQAPTGRDPRVGAEEWRAEFEFHQRSVRFESQRCSGTKTRASTRRPAASRFEFPRHLIGVVHAHARVKTRREGAPRDRTPVAYPNHPCPRATNVRVV